MKSAMTLIYRHIIGYIGPVVVHSEVGTCWLTVINGLWVRGVEYVARHASRSGWAIGESVGHGGVGA